MAGLESGWSLSLSNASSGEMPVWLEPWCDEFVLAPRAQLALIVEADEFPASEPELEIADQSLVVYAAPGTRIRVVIDGLEQDSASSVITTPDLGGLTTRGFVDVVFGNFPQARPGGKSAPAKRSVFRRLFRRQ